MGIVDRPILVTGSSGKLGGALLRSGRFGRLLAPSRAEMDIADPNSVSAFCAGHDVDGVIHCAALVRMGKCEADPLRALEVNIAGTGNLVRAVLEQERRRGKRVRFVHISTDGVYPGSRGRYSESDETIPYNRYGWTKLGAECAVHMLSEYCIVRTSFYDPADIPFEDSPADVFSSKITLARLVRAIAGLMEHDFVGTVNVGGERMSAYDRYRKHKPSLRPCTFADQVRTISYPVARDSSMNCDLWKKLSPEIGAPEEDEKPDS